MDNNLAEMQQLMANMQKVVRDQADTLEQILELATRVDPDCSTRLDLIRELAAEAL